MNLAALFAGAKIILRAAVGFVGAVVRQAIKEFGDSRIGRAAAEVAEGTADNLRAHAERLREEQAEMAAKYQRDRGRTQADADRADEIKAERASLMAKMDAANASEAVNELQAREGELSGRVVDDDEVSANIGILVTQPCPSCSGVMRIRAGAAKADGRNTSFYWQCTLNPGWCKTVPFDPFKEPQTIVRPKDAYLDMSQAERRAVWDDPAMIQKTHTRLRQHLGDDDGQIVCPTHLTPMKLLQKRITGKLLLDSYEYVCLGVGFDGKACDYTVPVVKIPQVAAALKRTEGRGII